MELYILSVFCLEYRTVRELSKGEFYFLTTYNYSVSHHVLDWLKHDYYQTES